jgi:hypothetical protein
MWQHSGVWCLDAVNSGELIAALRPHVRRYEFDVAWVGEGWRPLVEECHQRLVAVFPDYQLLNIKQKWGVLVYQAFPRERGSSWTQEEHAELEAITEEFQTRSATVCEWCGAGARLREWRTMELTLCEGCDRQFPDPPIVTSVDGTV